MGLFGAFVPYHGRTGIISLSAVLMIRPDFRQFVASHVNRADSNIRLQCSLFYTPHCLFLSSWNYYGRGHVDNLT